MPRRPRKHTRKKVKLHVKKNKKKINFEDPEIRKRWDKSKSPLQNYQNLGLKLNPNAENAEQPVANPVEFSLPPEPAPRPKNHEKRMTKMEELYYKALVDKHGTNWKAMARDMKLNYNQLGETKLEKRGTFYIENYRKPKEERKRAREELRAKRAAKGSKEKEEEEEDGEGEEQAEAQDGEEEDNDEQDEEEDDGDE